MNFKTYFLKDAFNFVFVNGSFEEKQSDALPSKITIEEGKTISIKKNSVIEVPLHFLFISSNTASQTHSHFSLHLGSYANVSVIERHLSLGQDAFENQIDSKIILDPSSSLQHVKIILHNEFSKHASRMCVLQRSKSQFKQVCFSLSGLHNQVELNVQLKEKRAECALSGFYFSEKNNSVQHHILVEHQDENTTSKECFKGVLKDRAKGVFDARVYVENKARNTAAALSNKNILLDEEAHIETRPQLEIYAEEVACTHGATVGYLDESALVYLKSRGLSSCEAKQVLLTAFAQEILSSISFKPLKEKLGHSLFSLFQG